MRNAFLRELTNPSKDTLAGLLCIVVGVAAVIIACDYDFGSPRVMGPGFFPVVLGCIIAGVGLVLLGESLRATVPSYSEHPWAFRSLVIVLAAVIAFAALIRSGGLIAAVVVLVVFGRIAGRDYGVLEIAVLSAVLVVLSAVVFILGLGMPLWLLPRP
jgi:hypothetical protein